jgi:hypothetical protein
MSHPNRLFNGDFAQDLSQWTAVAAAAFAHNEGNRELGAAYLPSAGSTISQSFSIGVGRPYMLEIASKGASSGTVRLTIANDNGTVYSWDVPVATAWQVRSQRVGLPWGDYTLTLAYNGVAVYVDDVSVAWVVKTRLELAQEVAARLGVLATTASMSTDGTDTDAEGDYTGAIDEGLRAVAAVDPAGRVDVRYLDDGLVIACLDAVELAMLKKLQRYWMTKTDYAIGPRTEHLNQISQALLALTGAAVGGRPASAGRAVKSRKLNHKNFL